VYHRFFDQNARNASTSEDAERLAGAEIRWQYPRMGIHWCAIPLALRKRARSRAGGLAKVCRSATQPKTRYQKDAQEYRGAGLDACSEQTADSGFVREFLRMFASEAKQR